MRKNTLDLTAVEMKDRKMSLDTLQASLFFLMTQYSIKRCSRMARAISEHIDYLCQHPHIHLLPIQYEMLCKMSNVWRAQSGNIKLTEPETEPSIH